MQSWGTASRFDERDTQMEPSKSGVLGLVCAALGRDRSESVNDLAGLKMGVRVDREGVRMRDFQTATGYISASGAAQKEKTVVSPRYYLANAVFVVGLEGDLVLLESIQCALQSPHWLLALGRKGFPPGEPVYLPDGFKDQDLRSALLAYPLLVVPTNNDPLRFILEHNSHGSVRLDQPIAPFAQRLFGPRYVASEALNVSFPLNS